MNGGPRSSSLLNIPEAGTFHHEYNSLACTLEIVDDVFAAIDHIHQHGRHANIFLDERAFQIANYLYSYMFEGEHAFCVY